MYTCHKCNHRTLLRALKDVPLPVPQEILLAAVPGGFSED